MSAATTIHRHSPNPRRDTHTSAAKCTSGSRRREHAYLILMRRVISAWLTPPAPCSTGAMTRCLPRSAILSNSRRSLSSALSHRSCHCSRLASTGCRGIGAEPGAGSAARSSLSLAMRMSSGRTATS